MVRLVNHRTHTIIESFATSIHPFDSPNALTIEQTLDLGESIGEH